MVHRLYKRWCQTQVLCTDRKTAAGAGQEAGLVPADGDGSAMKRWLLIGVICLALFGCSHPPDNIEDGLHWLEVVDQNDDYCVIRHRQTGVCYLLTSHSLIMLINDDGSPYTMTTGGENGH